ncbi:MAG: hypothetical protein HY718_11030 [Planctomycetes bacterium]|nr:hypothetical protein [Planctomycetota bacterium]
MKTARVVGFVLLAGQMAWADLGLTIDADSLRFIYTRGAGGPGTIGRIDVSPTWATNLVVQQIDPIDGSIVDLGSFGDAPFNASFTGEVFYLGSPNSYAVMGTYAITDLSRKVVLEGDFSSTSVRLNGDTLSIGGALFNQDGILQSGLTSGYASSGGAKGAGPSLGTSWDELLSSSLLDNALEVQMAEGYSGLDAFFGHNIRATTSGAIRTSIPANLAVVPAPGSVVLGLLGLSLVARFRRRSD